MQNGMHGRASHKMKTEKKKKNDDDDDEFDCIARRKDE